MNAIIIGLLIIIVFEAIVIVVQKRRQTVQQNRFATYLKDLDKENKRLNERQVFERNSQ